MDAWKDLETQLHGIAEDFTQGKYGHKDKVDTLALQEDICNAIDQYVDLLFDTLNEEE